jgi:hypothetical protein
MENKKIHLQICNVMSRKWDIEVDYTLLLSQLKEMIADFVCFRPSEHRIVCYPKIPGTPFMLWPRSDLSSLENFGVCDGDQIVVIWQAPVCQHS